MQINRQSMGKALVFGLLGAGTAAVMAANGYVVDALQQKMVQPGMTKAEVQNMLGKPPREATYAIAQGSTWVYSVRGRPQIDFISVEHIVYEVDFGADGRVVRAAERDLRD